MLLNTSGLNVFLDGEPFHARLRECSLFKDSEEPGLLATLEFVGPIDLGRFEYGTSRYSVRLSEGDRFCVVGRLRLTKTARHAFDAGKYLGSMIGLEGRLVRV